MILTPHAIVGAAVANLIPNNYFLGFIFAFVSHYLLDMIPHKDYRIDKFLIKETKTVRSIFQNAGAALHFLFVVFDFILAGLLCFTFFVRDDKSAFVTLVGLAGGVLPDFFQFMYYKYKYQPWIFFQRIHDKLHRDINETVELFWGILFQFVVPICVLVIYFVFR